MTKILPETGFMPGARNRAWVSCGVAVLLAAAHSAFGTFTAGLPLDALPDIRLTRELCDRALSEPKVQPLASETLQARVQRIQRLAAEGDPVGELGLAGLYAKGFGVPRSLPEAAKWCQKAAAAGVPLAQTWLGEMYDAGEAVPADPAQAVKWYKRRQPRVFPGSV